MKSTSLSSLILIAAVAVGCGGPAEEQDTASGASPVPSRQELASATYTGIEGESPITLADGRWEGEPYVEGGASLPTLWLSDEFYLTGDLDGNGRQEAIGYLDYNGGGTGMFGYLVAMAREGDAVVQKGIGLVGDRVQIRDARVQGSSVVLDVLQAGPDDGMCCPSQLATRTFTIESGRFTETNTQITGAASLATLEGPEWVLRRFSAEEDAPAEPEITLAVEAGRISGSSGCNTYTGGVTGGETATSLTIGPLASTRRACPPEVMDLETRYLSALQRAGRWAFRSGRLVITYGEGTDFGSLAFVRR